MITRAMRLLLSALAAVAGSLILVAPGAGQDDPRIAYSIELTGTIDPAAERSLSRALDAAADRDAEVAIVRIDTPGGLVSSTREIVQDIIDAPMPVVAYVSPDGARAASAGLFITEAADVAAMAPQTNIGSATPVSIGPVPTDEVLRRKAENDAAAYVRALADAHGRNERLAERMVTNAVNRTAEEAERAGLIDVVASSERELLRDLDGFRVRGPKSQTLDTGGLMIERHDSSQTVPSIELTGSVDPATERWLDEALDAAAERDAAVAIIRIDTPGGLGGSTREMVQDILEAPMPVIAYVSPDGARASSAGLFITEAADVAAMAPQTNIGSATPVSIGPGETGEVLGRKIENDAAAYLRALAGAHGRNQKLAERVVTVGVNRTAEQAERARLIDVVAPGERELLHELDGVRVRGPKSERLETEGLLIQRRDMPLQYDLIQLIVNPTIAYLLVLGGLAGLAVELLSGGSTIIPGVLGAISLLLGLYGTAELPVTLIGILLLVLGVALIIVEARWPTGFLGAAGVGSLIASGLVLYDTDSEALEVSAPVVIVTGLLLGGFVALAVQRTALAHRRHVMTGWEEMVGATGDVRQPLDPLGQVFVEGALWRARAADPGASVGRGHRVRVESVDGLTLIVRPLTPGEEQAGGAKQTAPEGAA